MLKPTERLDESVLPGPCYRLQARGGIVRESPTVVWGHDKTAMAKPRGVLWEYEEHTHAKHRILLRYLQAWLPIMARRNRRLNLIDGFAGPGRYTDNEPGSPLLMLDAYLSHRARGAMDAVELQYDFIENDPSRVAFLKGEIAKIGLPKNVHVDVTEGSFDVVMSGMLDAIPEGSALVPTFAFLDPFGYTDYTLELSSRILRFPKCEVLIYLPLPYIARFVDQESIAGALTNLFGDDSWQEARGVGGKAAARILHDAFLAKVRDAAGFARSFQIDAGKKGWSGYDLFFGTSNVRGLEKFKEAMWSVDPAEGAGFADSTDPDQLMAFDGPDLVSLETAMRDRFGAKEFSIETAERFVIIETPYAPAIHLKTRTLKPAEREGRIEARNPRGSRKRGTYPLRTLLRFTSPPGPGA